MTIAVGRQSVELTGTTVAAIAIGELGRLDPPFCRHLDPLNCGGFRGPDFY